MSVLCGWPGARHARAKHAVAVGGAAERHPAVKSIPKRLIVGYCRNLNR
jgi:hypothetical protein